MTCIMKSFDMIRKLWLESSFCMMLPWPPSQTSRRQHSLQPSTSPSEVDQVQHSNAKRRVTSIHIDSNQHRHRALCMGSNRYSTYEAKAQADSFRGAPFTAIAAYLELWLLGGFPSHLNSHVQQLPVQHSFVKGIFAVQSFVKGMASAMPIEAADHQFSAARPHSLSAS